ncbi:uncharacterized protein At5g08430-like isoform X3 [Miscanthus floridulus]|uniref:uncharacterized protein At5g08430-like isoform X3 n=1 Tax=Miscanthus floridulus TaxID=154761 RepID=UPI0034582B32
MSGKRQRQEKDKMAEECCFICKDSGHDLRVCDSRNCLKAYHPGCVQNKDEGFICDWHICVQCRGRSDYQCLCCPLYSVCCACLGKVEFVQLRKQNKGFCRTCLNLAIAIEKNDPHVAKTDNYEILFKDYWEGIKDAEHLTLVDLEEASDILNRKLNCKEGANLERFPAVDHKSDENTSPDNGANDQTIPFDSKGKQIKANTSQKNKSNKRTYVGWGSRELIGFLSSFGKDTSKPLEELEIIGVVKGYIKEKKLYQDDKKLRFLCDDKLQPLFTRRKVRCKMIRRFLAVHLASNAVSEDERFCSSEDDDDAPVIKKRPRNSLEPKIAKRVSERSKRHFASLTQNNINLIYLRKTLVISLLMSQPDIFEQKVVGCFVRVKCGQKVHSYEIPRKAYLLGQVTGIMKSENEYKINDTCTNILLCVTGLLDDVSISMLSDEDLAEDECDDLISLAEKGLLKRATVAELEEKVATVHKDIVNHWIERELVRLERKIDIAQMKGLHVELVELLDQKKLLNTPAERRRRLEEVPEIVPDTEYRDKETELQVAASNSSQESRGAAHQAVDSLNVLNGEPSKGGTEQIHDCLNVLNKESSEAHEACLSGVTPDPALHYQMDDTQVNADGSPTQAMNIDQDESDHSRQAAMAKINEVVEVIDLSSDDDEDPSTGQHKPEGKAMHALRAMNGDVHLEQREPAPATMNGVLQPEQRQPAHTAMNGVLRPEQHGPEHAATNGVSPSALLWQWHYRDPQGETQGPFTLMHMLHWKRLGFFNNEGFRVWKTGQTSEQAILLRDAFLLHL